MQYFHYLDAKSSTYGSHLKPSKQLINKSDTNIIFILLILHQKCLFWVSWILWNLYPNKLAQLLEMYSSYSSSCSNTSEKKARWDSNFGGLGADMLRSSAVGCATFDFKMNALQPTTWHFVDPALGSPDTDCSKERAQSKTCFRELPTVFFCVPFKVFFLFFWDVGDYNHFARRCCGSDTKLNNPPLHLSDEIRACAAQAVVFHPLSLFFSFFIIKNGETHCNESWRKAKHSGCVSARVFPFSFLFFLSCGLSLCSSINTFGSSLSRGEAD